MRSARQRALADVRHQLRHLLQVESQVWAAGGLGPQRLKKLEHKNSRRKRMYVDLSLEKAALKNVLAKKL